MENEDGKLVYFGNKPTKDGWMEIKRCNDGWIMYVLDFKDVKVVSITPRERKANFTLKWSRKLGRLDVGPDEKILKEFYPSLYEEVTEEMTKLCEGR